MASRKEIEKIIIDTLEEMLPNGTNKSIYQKLFSGLSDRKFGEFCESINPEIGGCIRMIYPNMSKVTMDFERNLDIAKSRFGFSFWQHLRITDDDTGRVINTPKKYFVVRNPIVRHEQIITKKQSIPKETGKVDMLTGQPTGGAKGSTMTLPETNILLSYGEIGDTIVTEFLGCRGGNVKQFRAMEQSIIQTGRVSLETVKAVGGHSRSTCVFRNLLLGAHLDNTLTRMGAM